jgi:hypothetical protein
MLNRIIVRGRASRGSHATFVLGILLTSGCAAVEPEVMKDGESLWRRIETEHFIVESNLKDLEKMRDIASEYETLWHAFAAVPILGMQPPDEKPIVVVFKDAREYRYFGKKKTAGLFNGWTQLGPLIAMSPAGGPFQATMIKHELAHFVSSDFLADAPRWLHEGLAQVMETARYDIDEGEILFGDHSDVLHYCASLRLSSDRFMRPWPAQLDTEEVFSYYGKSWLLVHYLIDHHLQAFLDFEVLISQGVDWKAAWAQEIPLALDDVDHALVLYHGKERYGRWAVTARLPDTDTFQESVAPAADIFAVRSVLQANSQNTSLTQAQKLDAANRDLATALDLDPDNARAEKIMTSILNSSQ